MTAPLSGGPTLIRLLRSCGIIGHSLRTNLYAERGSPKFEKAAMRWLERYLTEGSPRLQHFAEVTMSLAQREPPSYLRIEERALKRAG